MKFSDKVDMFLNENRINIKQQSPEEMAKIWLAKCSGDAKKANKIALTYANDREGEAKEKCLAAAKILHQPGPTRTWGGEPAKKAQVNPNLEKVKKDLEADKKASAKMSFKHLPEKFKKSVVGAHHYGENSVISHKGTASGSKLKGLISQENPLYIKAGDKEYLITKSYAPNKYYLSEPDGKTHSFEERKWHNGTKATKYKGHETIHNKRELTRDQIIDRIGHDVTAEVHEVMPDKIRQTLNKERENERNTSKNPNADIQKAVVDKFIGKSSKELEEKLKKSLGEILAKAGTDKFDPKEIDQIKNQLHDLHSAKRESSNISKYDLYDKANYAWDHEKKKEDTSKIGYKKPGLTWKGKDIIGKINKILGKGE